MRVRSSSVKGVEALEVDERLDNVLFNVWLVSRATTDLVDAALADTGLDSDEFALYSVLVAADGITPSELARWLAAPPTTVSSYVKRLESRGHAERRPNPDDGRSYLLHLTDAGRQAHLDAGTAFLPVLDRVTSDLGRSADRVTDALRTLRTAIDHARSDP